MSSTLEQYREAKQNWMKLRNQARKELHQRFQELSAELLQIQRELLEDFGEKVTISLKPKKAAGKKAASASAPAAAAPVAAAKPAVSPAVAALQKKLAVQQKKLLEAKAGGKPTQAIEDRIYEIEDDIAVAGGS